MALLVASLNRHNKKLLSAKLKQEQEHSATLKRLLEKQQQTDLEILRLNADLEEQIRKRTTQMQAILDNSPALVYLKDREGRYLLINQQLGKLFGLDRAGVVGKTDPELFPQDNVEQWNTNDQQVVSTARAIEMEEESLQADGVHIYLSVKFPLLDEVGNVYAVGGISTDITERKRAEDAIHQSEQKFRAVVENNPDIICRLDRDLQYLYVNPAARLEFSLGQETFLSRTNRELGLPLQSVVRWEETTRRVFETGQEQTLEYNFEISNGSRYFQARVVPEFDKEGSSVVSVLAIIRNITELKLAYQLMEQRVAERTADLTTLLEISHNVTSTLDLKSMAERLLVQLRQLLKYDAILLCVYDEEKFKLVDALVLAERPSLELLAPLLTQTPRFIEIGHAKKPVIVADLALNNPYRSQAGEQASLDLSIIRSGLFVPLLVKNRLVGMLVLTHREVNYYADHQAQVAQTIANQVAIAMENARLYEQAQKLAALEERQRLARELHDSTSQVLYSIQLGSRATHNFLKQGQLEQANEALGYVMSLAKGGLDEMRTLIFELRPDSLAREGLLGALAKQINALQARHGLEVVADLGGGQEPTFPLEYKEALYRIAREALHNVVKHAGATRVDLNLSWNSQEIQLIVRDYGNGFNPQFDYPGHLGLRSMAERVKQINGKLNIESSPGDGTLVRVNIPLPHFSPTALV